MVFANRKCSQQRNVYLHSTPKFAFHRLGQSAHWSQRRGCQRFGAQVGGVVVDYRAGYTARAHSDGFRR